MNSYPAKNTMKTNGFFSHNTSAARLLAVVFLAAFSSLSYANRPAMEEPAEETSATESQAQPEQTQGEQNIVQNRPGTEAHSAVEGMMERQGQQPQRTGDVVTLPAKEIQPGETLKIQLLDFPRRGMNMEKVQLEYGQPMATSEGVGQPPITSWTYNDRVVYFEYSTVLHVVAR